MKVENGGSYWWNIYLFDTEICPLASTFLIIDCDEINAPELQGEIGK